MNTLEISRVLKENVHTKHRFLGVFSCDTIPKHPIKDTCFVSNTDPQHLPGQHWVAFYVASTGEVYYFDSFGLPPLSAEFLAFVERSAPFKWQRNRVQLQDTSADTCGPHCVHFLIEACRTRNPKKCVMRMSKIPKLSDRTVSQKLAMLMLWQKRGVAIADVSWKQRFSALPKWCWIYPKSRNVCWRKVVRGVVRVTAWDFAVCSVANRRRKLKKNNLVCFRLKWK